MSVLAVLWLYLKQYTVDTRATDIWFTCRSQLSYGRYWEGRQQLQTMTARWADFCTQVCLHDMRVNSVNLTLLPSLRGLLEYTLSDPYAPDRPVTRL